MGEETHRYGKMEWFFYIIILPLLFTALLSGVILQFLGFDISGKIATAFKSLPGMHQTTQATNSKTKSGDPSKLLQDAQDKVKTLEKTKQQLEDDLAKKNTEISGLQKQVSSSKNQDQQNGSDPSGTDSGTSIASTVAPDPIQEQADIYAQMSSSKAAAILGNVSVTKAKQILSKMTSDQEASILQKMDPVIASKILSQ